MRGEKGVIGLIAGSGPLPLIFARTAGEKGLKVVGVGVKGYTLPAVGEVADMEWVDPGQLDRLLTSLSAKGVKEAAMVGKIPQSILLEKVSFDGRARDLLQAAKTKQTVSLLDAVVNEFRKEGVKLIDPRPFFESLVVEKGVLTQVKPSQEMLEDVTYGAGIAREVGKLDIGQTVVVKGKIILAVEAIEGTDATIERAAELGGKGIVVVKLSKPIQDMRSDIPVVGLETVKLLSNVKAGVLALEAGRSLIIEREEFIRIADEAGLCVVGI